MHDAETHPRRYGAVSASQSIKKGIRLLQVSVIALDGRETRPERVLANPLRDKFGGARP